MCVRACDRPGCGAQAANGSSGSFPTGGNVWPVAIYWISLDIGTPPKSFPVAIDSGSMTLDIQGGAAVFSSPLIPPCTHN